MEPAPKPLVSVIVACYNYGHFLPETLRSLQAQTYSNWECIVVDDGSTDDSRAVATALASEDHRIRVISQDNKGLAEARNTGIRAAKGDFFQWLDADDLLQSRKFELQLKAFAEDPSLDLVYSELRFFYDQKPQEFIYSARYNRPWTISRSGEGKDLLKNFIVSCCLMPPMALIRRKVVEELNGFVVGYNGVEDWDFWMRCAYSNYKFKYLPADETRSHMRLHNNNMTKGRLRMVAGMVRFRETVDKLPNISSANRRINHLLHPFEIIELGMVKCIFESTEEGRIYLASQIAQRGGLRIRLAYWASYLLPANSIITLVNICRSAIKKTIT